MTMKKTKWLFVILSLYMLTGLTACSLPSQKSEAVSAEKVKEANSEEEIDEADEDSIIAWGEVGYTDSEEINVDFPATVTQVDVKEGQAVKKGETLVVLDMNEYKQNLQKLAKQVSLGEVTLKDITQDPSAVAAEIAQLRADITKKSTEYNEGTSPSLQILQNTLTRTGKEITDAKKDYEKQKKLFAAGGVPQKVLDDCEDLIDKKEKAKIDTENNIKKTQDLLKDELDALKTNLEYKTVQLEKMQTGNAASVDKQNIAINVSQLDLSIMKTKFQKPYFAENKIVSNLDNAIIKSISVTEGSTLGKQNMAAKVMELINADSIVVRAEVPEEFVKNIKEGDKAEIIPKADNTKKITGTVTSIANMAVEKDGERIVKVEVKPVDDKEGLLKAGYSTDVKFDTKK